jgi:mannose-6-phosphate isomerase-like protein (cupin superfamily)
VTEESSLALWAQATLPGVVATSENVMNPETEPRTSAQRVRLAQLDTIEPVACPCGHSRRAFHGEAGGIATVHLTDISRESRAHYHRVMTEFYIVLEGEGVLEADGESYPLRPLTAVMIPPGCVHRAVGNLRILNVPVPAFDPADEFEWEPGERP